MSIGPAPIFIIYRFFTFGRGGGGQYLQGRHLSDQFRSPVFLSLLYPHLSGGSFFIPWIHLSIGFENESRKNSPDHSSDPFFMTSIPLSIYPSGTRLFVLFRSFSSSLSATYATLAPPRALSSRQTHLFLDIPRNLAYDLRVYMTPGA